MSSLVCYDISSSDEEEDCDTQPNNPDHIEKNEDSSSNIISNADHSSNEFGSEECSDLISLKDNNKSQETILNGKKNIQDSSTIVNIEESSNVSSPTMTIEESGSLNIPTVSIEEPNNLSSLNNKDVDIEIVVDTCPSQLPNIDETYRDHDIINISVDSMFDSSSSSDDDDSSSSLSDSESIETFSVSDDSSDSEVERSSGNKVLNIVSQTNSLNNELCSHCLNLKNNAPLESVKPINENDSSSNNHSFQESANVEHIDGTRDSESNNLSTCDDNSQEGKDSNMVTCDINSQEKNEVGVEKTNSTVNNNDYSENMETEESILKENIVGTESEITSNNDTRTTVCTCGQKTKENLEKNQKNQKPKKKKPSYYDEIELPPIEDLHISVEENEAKPIGTILHTVANLVVVKTYPGIPAINLDSILFLDQGKRALGRVDDVFGPIYEPLYVVRFNSPEHIEEK
ncbi:H/ACA ribonucleoprotein complex non-core subunit NAF1, partial [Armadillidium vulgare]